MHVKWGIENYSHAAWTWRKNFPTSRIYHMDVRDFFDEDREIPASDVLVDVLHLSPPCQPFSRAHTTLGRNDEENRAVLHLSKDIIRKTRPRIVTLEETNGLVIVKKHRDHWIKLLRGFTDLGFSVRWGLFKFQGFGIPQERERVMIFASWYVQIRGFSVKVID